MLELSRHNQQNTYSQRKQDTGGGSPAGGRHYNAEYHDERKHRHPNARKLFIAHNLVGAGIHGQQLLIRMLLMALRLCIVEI